MTLSRHAELCLMVVAVVGATATFAESDPGFPDPTQFLVNEEAVQVGSNFALSATLGDHMVLQREPASAVVWGFAPPGTVVTTMVSGSSTVYTSKAGQDNVWRAHLKPHPAGGPYNISFKASTGEKAALLDVLFGDVYVCGGQSNMQFSVGGNENSAAYAKEADKYPNIRLFTVGQKTSSKVPLMDLKTIEQIWVPAGAASVVHGAFDYFSAVCWFFGKGIYNGLGGKVPIGLVSNNWGGTRVEQWMPAEISLPCGHASTGELYNAMIVPYTVGPMAITGFTWYQGESDLGDNQNNNYSCTQTAMIKHWRSMFQVPHAFYGVVQLSTWYANPADLALLRDQQLASQDLIPNFALATNADHGAGGNIHPPFKQYPGARLANAALSMVYNQGLNWRSPTYASSIAVSTTQLQVYLNDVTDAGLVLKTPANLFTAGNCVELNAKAANTCAWAELQYNDPLKSWVNATVSLGSDKVSMVLSYTGKLPSGASAIIGSSYGWGAVPMMSVYRADMAGEDGQLPVLPWNRTLKLDMNLQDEQALLI